MMVYKWIPCKNAKFFNSDLSSWDILRICLECLMSVSSFNGDISLGMFLNVTFLKF